MIWVLIRPSHRRAQSIISCRCRLKLPCNGKYFRGGMSGNGKPVCPRLIIPDATPVSTGNDAERGGRSSILISSISRHSTSAARFSHRLQAGPANPAGGAQRGKNALVGRRGQIMRPRRPACPCIGLAGRRHNRGNSCQQQVAVVGGNISSQSDPGGPPCQRNANHGAQHSSPVSPRSGPAASLLAASLLNDLVDANPKSQAISTAVASPAAYSPGEEREKAGLAGTRAPAREGENNRPEQFPV